MQSRRRSVAALLALLLPASGAGSAFAADRAPPLPWTGVNFAGAAFAADKLPGRPGWEYFFPKKESVAYFAAKGMNIFRLCVLWERLQPALGAELDEPEMKRIDAVIDDAAARGIRILLDVHNYAAYRNDKIGSDKVSVRNFADLWKRLAARYKDKPTVMLGLMNEPVRLPTETWLAAANAAIKAIRDAGSANLVLVPGNGWSSAHDWASSSYGTPNATLMQAIVDPANNVVFEPHQYFDAGLSGTHKECISPTDAVNALKGFTAWARTNHRKALLGEFGVGPDANCLAVLDAVLTFMETNADVWTGWTYWAAGPWPRDYFTNIEPDAGQDRPQMAVLAQHIRR